MIVAMTSTIICFNTSLSPTMFIADVKRVVTLLPSTVGVTSGGSPSSSYASPVFTLIYVLSFED